MDDLVCHNIIVVPNEDRTRYTSEKDGLVCHQSVLSEPPVIFL